MGDYIIIGILAVIIIAAVARMIRNSRSGGCCGSGSTTIRDRKTLSEPIISEKTLFIDGMHCENCEIRVENALNRLDHAVSRVNWKKKTAVVSCSVEIPDGELKAIVEKLGYKVTHIR